MNYFEKMVHDLFATDEVANRVKLQDTVTMKIRKGDKVYRVVIEEITPVEKMEIEFEGDEPSRHPDYTE